MGGVATVASAGGRARGGCQRPGDGQVPTAAVRRRPGARLGRLRPVYHYLRTLPSFRPRSLRGARCRALPATGAVAQKAASTSTSGAPPWRHRPSGRSAFTSTPPPQRRRGGRSWSTVTVHGVGAEEFPALHLSMQYNCSLSAVTDDADATAASRSRVGPCRSRLRCRRPTRLRFGGLPGPHENPSPQLLVLYLAWLSHSTIPSLVRC